tara:strand:+ start:511 stop:2637 length:2127 start_codon:yes stop_codon:yes gene_type:complete
MALTTGDRLNKATVSSIQSRMGVVPAYKPTGIKKATDAVSAVLDVEAEKKANQEELRWKIDYKIKTRETITNFARENFDDPDTFTKLTDAYIASSEAQAPVRFKNFAKEFSSTLAFQKGDTIWNEANNKSKLALQNSFNLESEQMIASQVSQIMKLTKGEEEEYWFDTLLIEVSDHIDIYGKLWSDLTASEQAVTPDPDSYKQGLLLGFESKRLESNALDALNMAQSIDSGYIAKLGFLPSDYITEVSKIEKELAQFAKEYVKDPMFDKSSSGAVFTDSNYNEREKLIETVTAEIQEWNVGNKKNVDKQLILINQQKEQDIINFRENIEEGNIQTDEALNVFLYSINATDEQVKDIKDTNLKTQIITDLSRTLTRFENGKVVNLQDGGKLESSIINTKKLLENKGIDMTIDEIKQQSINMQMFSILNIERPNLTFKDYFSMDLLSVADTGFVNDQTNLTSLMKLSNTYGIVPDKLDDYFSMVDMLNFEVIEDQKQLGVMAQFAYNLSIQKGRPLSFKEGKGNDNFDNLVELHKSLRKVSEYNNAKRAGLTTSQLEDLEKGATEDRRNIIEQWFGQYINADQTFLDEKMLLLEKIIEDENLNVQKIIEDFSENKQEDGPWWGFGFFDTDLIDGNNEANISGRDNQLENSFQFVIKEMDEQLKLRVAASFKDGTYKGEMSKESIIKAYKKNLSYVLNTIRARGYGFNEND